MFWGLSIGVYRNNPITEMNMSKMVKGLACLYPK